VGFVVKGDGRHDNGTGLKSWKRKKTMHDGEELIHRERQEYVSFLQDARKDKPCVFQKNHL